MKVFVYQELEWNCFRNLNSFRCAFLFLISLVNIIVAKGSGIRIIFRNFVVGHGIIGVTSLPVLVFPAFGSCLCLCFGIVTHGGVSVLEV